MKKILVITFIIILELTSFNFVDSFLSKKSFDKSLPDSILTFPATKYNRLTGINIPEEARTFKKISIKLCSGEYHSFTILLAPKSPLHNIKLNWSIFKGENNNFTSKALDVYIAKVWFQAGINSHIGDKLLTQELLIKNDSLIKVDYNNEINYLLIIQGKGEKRYLNISTPDTSFPKDAIVEDNPYLMPFNLDGVHNKQLWFIIHVPETIKPGIYTSNISIISNSYTVKKFPLEVKVLPFPLDEPKLTYSIYYHGIIETTLKNYDVFKIRSYSYKTPEQLKIELTDLQEHGILYPTCYEKTNNLIKDFEIRRDVGLPQDKLFYLGIKLGNKKILKVNPISKDEIKDLKDKVNQYGYKELFIYGIDEAKGKLLEMQKPIWESIHEAGAKIFVAIHKNSFDLIGNILDLAVVGGTLDSEEAEKYHSKGEQIFSYANPQVGEENPEIYRRNYGLGLWKAGYNGAMDYAYQKGYGNIWNDFDGPLFKSIYRDENFTYPTSNGVISTVQWEGFREGVNDVRYLSTLINKIDSLKKQGQNVTKIEKWISSIDPNQDLDSLRGQIIDKILSLQKYN